MLTYENRNRATGNLLRAIQFGSPAWTPCRVGLMPGTWMKHREALEELVRAHPRLWPGFKGKKDFDSTGGNPLYEPGRHTDSWGAVWENVERGLSSLVVEEPLADWAAFDSWTPPDPMRDGHLGPREPWDEVARRMQAVRARGGLARGGGLPHGFFFMRLWYLRGFERLMLDMAADEPRLAKLIRVVEGYNVAVIGKYLELGAEYFHFGEDLGMQTSLPVSPEMWRRFVKPSYEAMFGPCRDAGAPVYLHSDGHILEIIPDLVETGVRVVNPQVRANGLDGLVEVAKGRVAIDLDLDRQLFPFATPSELDDHVGEAHEALRSDAGGLTLYAEIEPDVPLENVEAICTALERVCNVPEP